MNCTTVFNLKHTRQEIVSELGRDNASVMGRRTQCLNSVLHVRRHVKSTNFSCFSWKKKKNEANFKSEATSNQKTKEIRSSESNESENYEIHENKSKINSAIVKLLSSTSQIIVWSETHINKFQASLENGNVNNFGSILPASASPGDGYLKS